MRCLAHTSFTYTVGNCIGKMFLLVRWTHRTMEHFIYWRLFPLKSEWTIVWYDLYAVRSRSQKLLENTDTLFIPFRFFDFLLHHVRAFFFSFSMSTKHFASKREFFSYLFAIFTKAFTSAIARCVYAKKNHCIERCFVVFFISIFFICQHWSFIFLSWNFDIF